MNAPDSIEKAGHLQHDVVRRLKPSEPGRQELFRKTLEEEMEDELEEKRKKRPQDEVVLEHKDDAGAEADQHNDAERAAPEPVPDETSSDDAAGDGDSAVPAPPGATHVDVKA